MPYPAQRGLLVEQAERARAGQPGVGEEAGDAQPVVHAHDDRARAGQPPGVVVAAGRPSVLVIDEVGYEILERGEANLVFQVIRSATRRARSS
ncbi:ATP-binding protein [Nonomuraea sp. B19D2]|uniref:ATP-binding protein n=1 Tax=Nonomuraea sp. B19D2 TaxID=3159561 RepID=UPI0032DB1D78